VLDPFVGGGTTAIESKLLGRRCVALDINERALTATRDHTQFGAARGMESPALLRGDARALPLKDNTVDLVCAHPPYADIIRYSQDQPGDLSHLGVEPFLRELCEVADECFRVTRGQRACAPS
jgi:tRNA G10  N-methylase Trm11